MKKYILYTFIILGFFACKKVEKESNEMIDEPSEIIKDTVEPDVLKKPAIKSRKQIKEALEAKGFQTYDYVDETTQDTILMQQHFMVFLKSGPVRSQNEEEAEMLQKEHEAYLSKMYELGYADISRPFTDKGNIRSITIYKVPTLKMADSLAKADPMVKAGRLVIELHPWWVEKELPLR